MELQEIHSCSLVKTTSTIVKSAILVRVVQYLHTWVASNRTKHNTKGHHKAHSNIMCLVFMYEIIRGWQALFEQAKISAIYRL